MPLLIEHFDAYIKFLSVRFLSAGMTLTKRADNSFAITTYHDLSEGFKSRPESLKNSLYTFVFTEDNLPLIDNFQATRLFYQLHEQIYTRQKNIFFFGLFRKTHLTKYMDINEIINYAQNHARSKRVCIELGWLNQDGTLNTQSSIYPLIKPAEELRYFVGDIRVIG
jgi:hypothetical protein